MTLEKMFNVIKAWLVTKQYSSVYNLHYCSHGVTFFSYDPVSIPVDIIPEGWSIFIEIYDKDTFAVTIQPPEFSTED